jgi:hypothetical protein
MGSSVSHNTTGLQACYGDGFDFSYKENFSGAGSEMRVGKGNFGSLQNPKQT